MTLAPDAISAIASSTAQGGLGSSIVTRAIAEATVGSLGEDAVRITLVVSPTALDTMEPANLVQVITRIKRALSSAGESRPTVFSYSTEAELDDAGTEH